MDRLAPGKLFLPAEGEGRNAVYAAQGGWEVTAYDFSEEAIKSHDLGARKKVEFTYQNASLDQVDFPQASFDAVGIVYVQYPTGVRTKNFKKISSFLKPGGTLIMEVFSKNHLENQRLNPGVGGPKNIDQLYDLNEIKHDFSDFGNTISVIRLVGIRKKIVGTNNWNYG